MAFPVEFDFFSQTFFFLLFVVSVLAIKIEPGPEGAYEDQTPATIIAWKEALTARLIAEGRALDSRSQFAAVSRPTRATNLVANGGFETGDFSSWTQFGDTGFTFVIGNFDNVPPVEGFFQAAFGPVGSTGGITQSLPTTIGQVYTVSFYLSTFGGTPNFFDFTVGGQSLLSYTDTGGFPYGLNSFSVTATTTLTELRFTFQQSPSYFLLDDVQFFSQDGTE